MKALIVEDEELMRELVASVLSREFEFEQIDEAANGEDGLVHFEANDYDFVILDLMLPNLDGLSLARRFYRTSPMSVF